MKRFNDWLARRIVAFVGTMACAYLFAVFTLPALPQVFSDIAHGSYLSGTQWLTQSFIQLVLLPIIMVGQNLQNTKIDDVHDSVKEHRVATQEQHHRMADMHRMLEVLHQKHEKSLKEK